MPDLWNTLAFESVLEDDARCASSSQLSITAGSGAYLAARDRTARAREGREGHTKGLHESSRSVLTEKPRASLFMPHSKSGEKAKSSEKPKSSEKKATSSSVKAASKGAPAPAPSSRLQQWLGR